MGRVAVTEADRKVKRDIQKVFGDNFYKIITEMILNSDDSYARLEATRKQEGKRRITLWLDRDKRMMKIVDHAEGMSLQKLETIFSKYGGDYSGGDTMKRIRGLFGQGASDVMFLSALHGFDSYMITIQDNQASRCDFFFSGKKEIETYDVTDTIETIRNETGIHRNGTYAVFGIHEGVSLPRPKDIKKNIESFYMLRYILANPNRDVRFYDGELMHRLSSQKYMIGDHKILLNNRAIKLDHDSTTLKSVLTLYEKKDSDPQKIIIRDENNVVYDDTMFGLDKFHGSTYIAGEYIIHGISDFLRERLNADVPEEILRDSRDGFDGRTNFTKQMFRKVGDIVMEIIEENNLRRETVTFSLSSNKKLHEALKKINNYFNELALSNIAGLNTGDNPPPDGIQFARPVISISRNKWYGLHLYINASQIQANQEIKLIYEKNDYITFTNDTISYHEKDVRENNLVIKNVIIKAHKITTEPIRLKASIGKYETTVLINVVKEKIIYPENGLEFIPKRKEIGPGKKFSFALYFDTEYIPLGTSIIVTTQYESKLLSDTFSFVVSNDAIIAETIGMRKIPIEAHKYNEKISIEATCQEIVANAVCYVKEPKDDEEGNEGLLNKIELTFDKGNWQTSILQSKGLLTINGQHPINKAILGNLKHLDPNNPDFNDDQLKYIFELLSHETAKLYVTDKMMKEESPDIIPERLFDEVQEHKTKVYKDLIE